jgi:hypothetical protein
MVEPAKRGLYYMQHGTSHGSSRTATGKQGSHEVIPLEVQAQEGAIPVEKKSAPAV